jgi:hypothetical protein
MLVALVLLVEGVRSHVVVVPGGPRPQGQLPAPPGPLPYGTGRAFITICGIRFLLMLAVTRGNDGGCKSRRYGEAWNYVHIFNAVSMARIIAHIYYLA